MGEHLTGRLVDQMSTLPGRTYDKQTVNVPYDDTELRGLIADNAEGIEANAAAIAAEAEARVKLEEKHDADHQKTGEELALANRKIRALTDVLAGKELGFDTQEYNAAAVAVPSGAVADSILKIGGKSVVWSYLLNINNDTINANGITGTISKQGLTAQGTCTGSFIKNLSEVNVVGGHLYYMHNMGVNYPVSSRPVSTIQLYGTDVCNIYVNENADKPYIFGHAEKSGVALFRYRFDNGTTYSINSRPLLFDLTQMFGSGNEPISGDDPRIKMIEDYALAHPEYNPGEIVSSQIEAVEVRGKNLWENANTFILKGSANFIHTDGTKYLPINIEEGSYTLSIKMSGYTAQNGTSISFYDENHATVTGVERSETYPNIKPSYKAWFTFTADHAKRIKYISIYSDGTPLVAENIQLEKGKEATPYQPHHDPRTIPLNLPELRSAGNVHDERDYSEGKQRRRIGVVEDIASLAIYDTPYYSELTGNFVAEIKQPRDMKGYNTWKTGEAVCKDGVAKEFDKKEMHVLWTNTSQTGFTVAFPSGSTIEDVREYYRGTPLYYELEEEVVTDIDPIPELEAITVEAGGEVRFVDSDAAVNLPIPSTHEWIVRNAEV